MAKKSKADKLQDDLRESAHRIWLAGLGALSTVEEKGGKWFQQLVEKGKTVEAEGKTQVHRAKAKVETEVNKAKSRVEEAVEDLGSNLEAKLAEALHRFGVPTRDEIRDLTKRVEQLNARIDKAKAGGSAAKAAPAAKKAAPAARATKPAAAAKKEPAPPTVA
jgi:poly(hydroxyalkanoate) granule-associated protein